MHNRIRMAIPATTNISANVSEVVQLGIVLDFVKEQWNQTDLMADVLLSNTSINHNTDVELENLLMPIWAYQSAAVYLSFISVFGLLMNIVVVIVIINDPQRMTPLNWMLLNLACSDGMIAGFGTPVSAAAAFQYHWPFGDEMCVAYAMIMSTAGIGSITTLTALALWRCQLVVYCPAKRSGAFANHHSSGGSGGSSGKLGRVQATILLTLIWTYSLAVTCPPLFGWGRYDREAAHISCSVNWESKMANNRSYILYMFSFGLVVPFIVIVASYLSILRVVKKTKEMRRKTQASLTGYNMHQEKNKNQQVESDHSQQHPHSSGSRRKSRQKRGKNRNQRSSNSEAAEKRVTVMVACMVGAFMAAWTPYSILALFETFIGGDAGQHQQTRNISSSFVTTGGHRQMDDEKSEDPAENFFYYVGTISPAFATIPSLFAKTSAVLNPLIYGLLNTQFRSAWEKFSTRFLSRRRHRRHRRHNSQEPVMTIQGNKRKKNKKMWQFLNCARSGSPTLIRSATVHLSMKEIVSNESQSAYILTNAQGKQVINSRHHLQYEKEENEDNKEMELQRRGSKNPAMMSISTTSDLSETSVTQTHQTMRMKSLRNRLQSQQQEEPKEQKVTTTKLVVVRMISESTSCSCTNGDQNVVTTTLEEEISVETSTEMTVNAANKKSATTSSPG